MIDKLEQKFKTLYKDEPLFFRSPGRINLLGEHIDYNEGIVFPAAIDQYIYIAIGARNDDQIHLYSMDYEESFQSSIHHVKKTEPVWTQYILGVVDQFQKSGVAIHGFNMVFGGNIAQGAGLSSSAALECAVAFGLQELNGLTFRKMQLAKLAQAAENQFVGVNCGLMDQFASVFGKKDQFIQLDCQSLAYGYFPFDSTDYCFFLLDTQVKHSLASSAYNERRQQCETGVAWIAEHHPEIKSLRDVDANLLSAYVEQRDPLIHQRCLFVIEEIQRVKEAGQALVENDLQALGKLMFATHEGLSKAYEVSCPEMDFLVNEAKKSKNIIGARMMGGGFGGCTLNLIKKGALAAELHCLSIAYKKTFNVDLKIDFVTISDGTKQVYKE